MKKRLTIFLALLCMSVMGWAYSLSPNTTFGGNYKWQEIDGVTPPANVVNVQSHEGYDCLYITFADAAFNRDYIVGGDVFTNEGAQAWLKLASYTEASTDVLFYNTGSTTDVKWGLRILNTSAGGGGNEPEPAISYCRFETGHLGNAAHGDVNGRILLTLRKLSNSAVRVKIEPNNNGNDYFDLVHVELNGVAKELGTVGGAALTDIEFDYTGLASLDFSINVLWHNHNWADANGRWTTGSISVTEAELCTETTELSTGSEYCCYYGNETKSGSHYATLTWETNDEGDVVITIGEGPGETNTRFRGNGFEGNLDEGFSVLSGEGYATSEVASTYFNRVLPSGDKKTYTLQKKGGVTLPSPAKIKFTTKAFAWTCDQAGAPYSFPTFEYTYGKICNQLDAPTNVAIDGTNHITFNTVANATRYTAFVSIGAVVQYSQIVASGDELLFAPIASGDYHVSVVAWATGYTESDPSTDYIWHWDVAPVELGNSEYCEANMSSGNTLAGFTWETDANGNIVITISEALGGAANATHFRGNALALANFKVGAGQAAGSNYFSHPGTTTGNQLVLTTTNAPALGEKIYYNGVVEYATSLDGNAWPTLAFEWTYGTECSGITVSATPNNNTMGTAVVKKGDDVVTSVESGDQVTFIATVADAELYRFVNWTKGGVEVSTSATYTTTITETTNLVANFDYIRNAYCQYIVLSNESAVKGKKLYMTVGSVGGGRYQIKFEGSTEAPLTGLSNANYVGNKITALTDVEDQPKTGNDVPFTKANGRWVFSAEGNGSASMQFELAEGRTIDDIYFWANAIYFNTAAGELGYVDNNDRLGLFGMNATHRHNIAWNETCSDAENPVMTSATLASTTVNSAVINVAATDDHVVDAFRVVETTHGIDVVYPVAAQITITGLTAGNTYNFTITAIDASGKVSANSKAVKVELAAAVTAPTTAAPTPPARDDRWVRPIYSDAYTSILEHDFALSNWGSKAGTREVVAGDNYLLYDFSEGGNTVVWGENNASNNAIVAIEGKNAGGDGDNTGVDASAMEYLHVDIWSNASSANVEVRINDNMLARVNLTGAGWQQFDLPLSEHVENINPTSVRWMKFTNISGADHIAIDNAYFWREPVAADESAPSNVRATAIYTDLYSVLIELSATENNDDISYSIKLGDVVKAVGVGKSDVAATIRVAGLTPNTNYTFAVVATDVSDNSAAPVNVTVRTKALPEPAPASAIREASVKALYSNAYTPVCTVTNYCENWWQAATLHNDITLGENDNVLYYDNIPSSSAFGWGFATPKVDAAGFQKLHFDIYPMQSGTIELYPVKEEGGELYRTSQTLVAETWNEVVLDYTNETLEDVFKQLGFRNYSNLGAFFIDNVYFFKTEEATLDQDATTPDALNALNGAIANVEISRTLSANGNFKTLCLPFSMNAEQIAETFGDCEILMLTGGRMKTETDIYVQYSPVNEIIAGKPYLMTVQSDVPSLNFDAVVINSSTDNNEVEVDLGGNKSISMLGTFVKKSLTDDGLYYLDTDGYLHSVSAYGEENGGAAVTIPAFRCYYQFNGFGGNNAPIRARVVRTTDVVTDCEDIVNAPVAIKQLRDRQLFILRDGNRYTVTGLRVE